VRHNADNTAQEFFTVAETPRESKESALRRHRALNPRPQTVGDAAFSSGNSFFDARDLVQVKYEMLRRVREDGQPVSQVAADFGFSRPSFYQTQTVFDAEGLPGLVPQRPGPKRAHKLSEEVVDRLDEALMANASLNSAQLAQLVEVEFGLSVHRRSVERALDRRRKKGAQRRP
jgi:transposase